MAKQLMIYDQVVPISAQRHADLSVETGLDYQFASKLKAVPLVAAEIAQAAREYTVVFAPTGQDDAVLPFAILGIKEDENLYLSADGDWSASYIPAFVRRYPFVFSTNQDGNTLTLCIDESWQGCNRDGRGQQLFDQQGNRTEYLDRLLKFNEEYQRSYQMTEIFCKKLKELDLLEAKEATLRSADGTELKLRGFFSVNREKVNQLPGDSLAELAKSNALELIYAQLLSINNLANVARRADQAAGRANKD